MQPLYCGRYCSIVFAINLNLVGDRLISYIIAALLGEGSKSILLYHKGIFNEEGRLKSLLLLSSPHSVVQKRYMNHHQNLSQQIKQINSIEHKKISGMSIFGKLGKSVGSRKYRRNYTPVDSIN